MAGIQQPATSHPVMVYVSASMVASAATTLQASLNTYEILSFMLFSHDKPKYQIASPSAVLFSAGAVGLLSAFTAGSLDVTNSFFDFCSLITQAVRIVSLSRQKHGPSRFRIALNGIATTLLVIMRAVACSIVVADTSPVSKLSQCTIAVSLLCFPIFLTVPRDSDAFFQGRPVDRQGTASIFELMTFTWATNALQDHVLEKKDPNNLPVLSEDRRTDQLVKRHQRISLQLESHSLGFVLTREYLRPLLLQWTLASLHSVSVLVRPLFTYRLLQILGGERDGSTSEGLVLAVLVGLSKVGPEFIKSWLDLVSSSMIETSIYHTLSSLTYQKALSVPSFAATRQDGGLSDGASLTGLTTASFVACGAYTNMHRIVSSVVRLVSTTWILVNLVGFQGVIISIAASLLVIPLTTMLMKCWETWLHKLWALGIDRKTALGDALLAIRQIKISAGEASSKEKIHQIRLQELKESTKISILMVCQTLVSNISPAILSGLPLYIYSVQGHLLTAPVVFTFIGLFKDLQNEMFSIPQHIPRIMRAFQGIKSVQSFLSISDLHTSQLKVSDKLSLDNATLSWYNNGRAEQSFKLINLNAEFPLGALSIVTGKTGCGKSLVLLALAGEAEITSGQICRPGPGEISSMKSSDLGEWIESGKVTLVTQNPWMANATVQDNILFGLPMNRERYARVLYSCALNEDLAKLKDGDATIIAIKGVSLSGGQRWRIALARALYSRASLLLMDDVLSAVDAEVREWIVVKALCGDLSQGRTRVLVTHHEAQVISRAAYRLHICDKTANGEILPPPPISLIAEHTDRQPSSKSSSRERKVTTKQRREAPAPLPTKHDTSETLLQRLSPYRTYFKTSGGFPMWTLALFFVVICEGSNMMASARLKAWVNETDSLQKSGNIPRISAAGAYFFAKAIHIVILSTKGLVWFRLHRVASDRVFKSVTAKIFGARLQWLESTSHGEILRRYGPDMRVVDEVIGYHLDPLCGNIGQIITVLVANATFSLYEAPFVGLLFYFFFRVGRTLIPSTKHLQDIYSVTNSSFTQKISALAAPDGITTVRAYGLTESYVHDFNRMKDESASASWHGTLYKSMMNLRLESLGAIYVVMSCGFLVFTRADAATAGVALSFASTLSSAVVRGLQRLADLDTSVKKVEQLVLYDEIEQERVSGVDVADSWPEKGEIKVAKLSAGYGPNLPATLKDLSFTVKPGEQVGVVGRTGAGKSTLALAFADLVQKRSGTIHIDSVDISEVRLETLRKNILIIPQDPYLFSGRLRNTLDPKSHHTDSELLAALRKYGFLATIPQADGQGAVESCLELNISDGGTNLSQGQRQIICLVKAMLSRKRVIIMDEATSAVDMETDSAIQTAIRDGLWDTTVIVIAHRLATVAHLDKVLVMHEGEVAEFGPPADLFRQKGQFWALVNHSADREVLVKRFGHGE